MADKRDECGCHRDCTWTPHDCERPCAWPSCLTDDDQAQLASEVLADETAPADVVTFDVPVEVLRSPEIETWRAWFRAHGVDPTYVALPCTVERREAARQLVYTAFVRRPDGSIVIAGDDVARVQQVVQLEAAPLPWPVDPHAVDAERYRWGAS